MSYLDGWDGDVLLVASNVELRQALENIRVAAFVSLGLKGPRVCSGGQISVLTLKASGRVYIVDLHILGSQAFEVEYEGFSLRSMLESESVKIAMFDCRNTSSAMCSIYGIEVKNVVDTQLYFIATQRPSQRNFLPGLETALKRSGTLKSGDAEILQEARRIFSEFFVDAKGGDQETLLVRPLDGILIAHASLDVYYIEQLYDTCRPKLHLSWLDLISRETNKRIAEATSPSYEPWNEARKLAPGKWNTCASIRDVLNLLEA